MEAFPCRLPEQPIFYPVLSEDYAIKIARDWNVPASGSGFVTRFEVKTSYLDQYPVQEAGGRVHLEYWINTGIPVGLGVLQRLSIGDSAAENEFTTLKSYYIPTDAFGRTLQGQIDLVSGRKGSGKTALFFQLRDRLRADKKNVIVDLKPEGYQLTQLKDQVLKFLKAASQSYLITAFWHYIILLEIVHRIIESDKSRQKFDHRLPQLYQKLSAVYSSADVEFEGDFSQRLLRPASSSARRRSYRR
jgi:hypothetical protein